MLMKFWFKHSTEKSVFLIQFGLFIFESIKNNFYPRSLIMVIVKQAEVIYVHS